MPFNNTTLKQCLLIALRTLLSIFFIYAGITHFTNPSFFLEIMPPYIPFHRFCVALSGLFEIVGGLSLLVFGYKKAPLIRQWAGLLLIATLVGVFPANIHMALNQQDFSHFGPTWALYLRLPIQFVLIGLVWLISVKSTKNKSF